MRLLSSVVNTTASKGWDVSSNTGTTKANVAPGATVDFANVDKNVVIGQAGTNLTVDLAKNIDLGTTGSVTTGNSKLDTSGLTVNDGAGSVTTTGATGTTVTGAAGTTTVAAGTASVSDGTNTTVINPGSVVVGQGSANPITLDSAKGKSFAIEKEPTFTRFIMRESPILRTYCFA